MNVNVQALQAAIEEAIPEVNITFRKVVKFDEEFEAMTVTPAGSCIGASLSLSDFEKRVERYGLEEAISTTIKMVKEGLANAPKMDIEKIFNDYDQVRKNLAVEVVGIAGNEELLAEVPYEIILGDLAIVARYILEEQQDGRMSILIRNEHLAGWNIDKEQLLADAKESSPAISPMVLEKMGDAMRKATPFFVPDEEVEANNLLPVRVASNSVKSRGASVITYSGFIQAAQEALEEEEFYILPSSKDEVLVFAASHASNNWEMSREETIDYLADMVRGVNETQLPQEEILSYGVYYCDGKTLSKVA